MVRVSVVVLGDIGRSPRMQYHSISLAENGHEVDLIGYGGSRPHHALTGNDKINIRRIRESPTFSYLPSIFGLVFKCVWQAVTLLWCLTITVTKLDFILMQNPPGLPALFVCWIVSRLRGARFIIDWHNYTWSILALRWSKDHPLVRIVRYYEYKVGGRADDGFCVTEAMKDDLRLANRKIAVNTFYDRPLKNIFRPVTLEERHEVMKRMAEYEPGIFGSDDGGTRFTELSDSVIRLRDHRPALLISSTSWTADENFGMLFEALTLYDQKIDADSTLPELVMVVTGKGPLKEYYLERLPQWKWVQFCAPWLAAEDYSLVLASADLGVCLHASSSGLDLPMKAVDMLGCRVPVAALKYHCIEELVKPNQNGLLFDDAESLADVIQDLLSRFGTNSSPLRRLKERLDESMEQGDLWDWETNWEMVVKPVFSSSEL